MSEFVEMKTQDLSGAALDWAVAQVEQVKVAVNGAFSEKVFIGDKHGLIKALYKPSTDWSKGGPLIEKYGVDLSAPPCIDRNREIGWQARPDDGQTHWHSGETALIAAMRSIVTAKIGYSLSVPKELLP